MPEVLTLPHANTDSWLEGVNYDICTKCNSWQPCDRPHACAPAPAHKETPPPATVTNAPARRIWPLGLFCIDCNQCYLHPNGAMFCHSTPQLNQTGRPDCTSREPGAWKLFDSKNPPDDGFPGTPHKPGKKLPDKAPTLGKRPEMPKSAPLPAVATVSPVAIPATPKKTAKSKAKQSASLQGKLL